MKLKLDPWDKFLYFVLWPPCVAGAIYLLVIVLKAELGAR